MRKKVRMLLATIAVTALSAAISAHHGAATFDTANEITLKGTVTEWTWFNPHCFLKFDVKDASGAVKNWAVEAGNPTDMSKRGWSRTMMKPGDEVTVTLQPVKTGAPVGRIMRVTLPDGRELR